MPKLIYSNSRDSNMFYAVKVDISSDSFFYLENEDKKYIFLDLREFEVFKEQNKNSKIEPILLEPLFEKCDEMKVEGDFINKLALLILQEFKLENTEIEVPNNFPVGMADFLRSQKINLKPIAPFFPERRTKTPLEISFIKENIKKTLKAFELIEQILRDSKIKNNKIYFQNQILTSEFLRLEVEKLFLENGLVGDELIISSGYQTAIPHHRGSGEIKPNSFIICDIFPKDKKTGYFADITRTFVKGKATDEMLAIFNSVKKAQIKAINSLKSGIEVKKIHEMVVASFKEDGFETKENQGFIHSTGHSFGLDIHEKPLLSDKVEDVLQENDVVTIEPGLYFPKLGGVRIEDDILITKNGFENLVDYPKNLIIE